MKRHLSIQGLRAGIAGKQILDGLDLEIRTGEIHALMGPNGSGKSTLANVLMGNPAYEVTGGAVTLDGADYLGLSTTERALLGVYLAFQYPVEIPGVTVGKFLKRAVELRVPKGGMNVSAYIKRLREAMDFMEMDQAFINRYLNQGFSGGEKKRMEVLQMIMLEPSFAIMDETDSGLDIDALKVVAKGVNRLRGEGFGALIITHYRRILEQIRPDKVHVMYQGRIVTSGGPELIEKLEAKGYDWVGELAQTAGKAMRAELPVVEQGEYVHGYHFPDESVFKTRKGLDEEVVRAISAKKDEPDWMLQFRLRALAAFRKKAMPNWGADLSSIDFDDLYYYAKPQGENSRTWEDVPDSIKETFDRIGIPEAERKFLAGVGAQYDSEVVYHSLKEDLAKQGVIFTDPETAVREHPEIVRKYFGTIIPYLDNKFAALNSAVWSGGSFVYIPKGVKVEIPLQAYFRINAKSFGQFERTLIIAEEGSFVHYIEGCTAPVYATESLHSAVVEIIALEGARVRYTTIQNWSNDVYNLVTKRAVAYKDAVVEWVDGNIGSKRTMKYPAIWLMGEGAHGEVLSLAFAGEGQEQDTGAKIVHAASHTSSVVTAKSISKDGGISSYRGLLKVKEGLHDVRSRVVCDALILDPKSASNTYPTMEIESDRVSIEHEARVSRIGEDQLFYLMSRGLSEAEASLMIVAGFLDPLVKQLPMEYAVELNRLIELEMEGTVG